MKSILSIFEIGQRGVGRLTFFKRIQPLLLKFKGIIPDFAIKRFINKEMIYIIKCYDIFYNNDRFLPILSDYRIAKGILYMFDLTDESSITYIKNEIKRASELKFIFDNTKLPVIYIIGNKCDLKQRKECIKEVDIICQEKEYKYFECSGLKGKNVNEIIHCMVRDIEERIMLLQTQKKKLQKINKCLIF